MTMRVFAVLSLLNLMLSPVVVAQPAPKVYGVGVQSCSEWLQQSGSLDATAAMQVGVQRLAVIAWVTGYVTGAAAVYATEGVLLRDTTGTDIVASVERHCKGTQASSVERAAASLVRELRGR